MHFSQLLPSALLAASAVTAAPFFNFGADKARVLIPPKFFDGIVRYTRFSAASYTATLGSGVCDHPPYGSTIVSRISINSTDTQAAIFRDDKTREFIVAFPGTTSTKDYNTDFNYTQVPYSAPGVNCPTCKVHEGFLIAYNSIVPSIRSALDCGLKEHPTYMVTLTGHSLGGALAALAFPSLKGLRYPIRYTYTYGQPRVSNSDTAAYIDRLAGSSNSTYGSFRRVTHSYDGVPNLPPQSLNYTHPMTEFFELDNYISNGTQIPLSMDTDALSKQRTQAANSTYRCFGHDAPDCNRGAAMGFINQAHLMYSGVQMVGGDSCSASATT